jgi:hypothetical protein
MREVLQAVPLSRKPFRDCLEVAAGIAKSSSVSRNQPSHLTFYSGKTYNKKRHGCSMVSGVIKTQTGDLPDMPTWK